MKLSHNNIRAWLLSVLVGAGAVFLGAGVAFAVTGQVFQAGGGYEIEATSTATFDITTVAGTGGPIFIHPRRSGTLGVYINQTGGIGIDTTGPVNNLDVAGTIGWGTNAGVNVLQFDQGGSMELGGNNTVANPIVGGVPYIDFHYGTGAAQDYNARIINSANNRLDLYANSGVGTPALTLSGTNVGVGTTGPQAPLSIAGGTLSSGRSDMLQVWPTRFAFQQVSGDQANACQIDYGRFDSIELGVVGKGNGATNRGVRIYDALGIGYSPNSANGALLVNGNVGIGVTGPGYPLDVNGSVRLQGGTRQVVFNNGIGEVVGIEVGSGANATVGIRNNSLVVGANAQVGIATTSPAYNLDVVGTARFSQPVFVGTPTAGSHAATKDYVDAAAGSSFNAHIGTCNGLNCTATASCNASTIIINAVSMGGSGTCNAPINVNNSESTPGSAPDGHVRGDCFGQTSCAQDNTQSGAQVACVSIVCAK